MEVKIRIAKKDDAEYLQEIYSYYVANTAVSFEYEVPSVQEFERRICTTLENYPYLVAEVDGKIAGYAYASRFGARAAFDWSIETSIYIGLNYHRLGLGKLLYEELEKILTSQNITNLYARIADPAEDNDEHLSRDSQHFHEAQGYKLVGKMNRCGYKFDRWYNLIYMEKTITEHKQTQAPFIPFKQLQYIPKS